MLVTETPKIANKVFQLISPALIQKFTDHHNQLLHEFQEISREILIKRDPSIALSGFAAYPSLAASAFSGQPEAQTLAAEGDEAENYDAFAETESTPLDTAGPAAVGIAALQTVADLEITDEELETEIRAGLAAALPSMLGNAPFATPSTSMVSLFANTVSASTATGIAASDSIGSLSAIAAFGAQFEQLATAGLSDSVPPLLFADTAATASTPLKTTSSTASVAQSIQLSPTAADRTAITLPGDATQYANPNTELPTPLPLDLSMFARAASNSSLNTTGSSPSAEAEMAVRDAPPADQPAASVEMSAPRPVSRPPTPSEGG